MARLLINLIWMFIYFSFLGTWNTAFFNNFVMNNTTSHASLASRIVFITHASRIVQQTAFFNNFAMNNTTSHAALVALYNLQ